MSDEHEQPEKVWDEYDWERFLQQQDQKAEHYLELLERYTDHPERDELVAREMGWLGMGEEEAHAWLEEVEDEFLGEVMEEFLGEEDEDFEAHPLYKLSFELTVWLDDLLEEKGDEFALQPAVLALSEQTCVMGGKLAAALSDPDGGELGMTIAYLKRALRAATLGLEAAARLNKERLLGRTRSLYLKKHLFEVRDGIVELMGKSRAEWRRRYES